MRWSGMSALAVLMGMFSLAVPLRAHGDAASSEAIRQVIARQVPDDGPGAVVVVLKDGTVIAQNAFGLADVARRLPITMHTVFDLASCSKQFTAMAVMILAERGKLSLEEDARKFLPELEPRDPPIRIADLLHMTSGLPDYEKLLDHLEDKTNLNVLNAVAHRPLLFKVGEKYNYCDTNYVLLAVIIERVSGDSFATFLKREIFGPSGMKQAVVLERPDQVIPDRAEGYTRGKDQQIRPNRLDTRTYGDGQVMASADDLVAWDQALRDGHLVSREMLRRAFSSGTLSDGRPCGYGFGWAVPQLGDEHRVEHGGGWFGTSAFIRRDLDAPDWTVIVLSNLEHFPAAKVASEAIGALNPMTGRGRR